VQRQIQGKVGTIHALYWARLSMLMSGANLNRLCGRSTEMLPSEESAEQMFSSKPSNRVLDTLQTIAVSVLTSIRGVLPF
jgi:hypothetical protein